MDAMIETENVHGGEDWLRASDITRIRFSTVEKIAVISMRGNAQSLVVSRKEAIRVLTILQKGKDDHG